MFNLPDNRAKNNINTHYEYSIILTEGSVGKENGA